jgi:hypothetical protein
MKIKFITEKIEAFVWTYEGFVLFLGMELKWFLLDFVSICLVFAMICSVFVMIGSEFVRNCSLY